MKFEVQTAAKKLIANQGDQITVSIESEVCYACSGQIKIPSPIVRLGKPEDCQFDQYKIVLEKDITVYVQKELYLFDPSVTFAIGVSDLLEETLTIYGVVPES